MNQTNVQDVYQDIQLKRRAYRESILHTPLPESVDKNRILNIKHNPKAVFAPTEKYYSSRHLGLLCMIIRR